jgi:putative ABC transport system permease protein
MDTLLQDIRYALRQLAAARGFTIVAVLTLAIGIGANTAIFSAVDAVLLKPLPFPGADRIFALRQHNRARGIERELASPGNFFDWRERSRSFEALAAADPWSIDYVSSEGPDRLQAWRVTEGFFDVMGVPPLLGRTFRADDYTATGGTVAVLTHSAWQSRFGGDADIVGRAIVFNGQLTTVIGVMPPRFGYPSGGDVWLTLPLSSPFLANRAGRFWEVAGKLAPGVDAPAAQAELDTISAQLGAEYPATNAEVGVALVPISESLVGQLRPGLLLLLAAVGAVLLIACVNVASLLLARAADRRREFAVRSACGASRARVIRQLVTESIVLAILGGAGGILLASWGLRVLGALRPDNLPHVAELAIDARVLVFASLLALGTALVFGLAPALHAARTGLNARLHATPRMATPAGRRVKQGLVVAELSLATVLLISAGLLVRSLVALLDVERGYRTDNVAAVTVQAWRYYADLNQRQLFVDEALERIAALPGVSAAGMGSALPLAAEIGANTTPFAIKGRTLPQGDDLPVASMAIVTAGYFDALGIPLLEGRSVEASDDDDAARVILINQAMARRYWGVDDPLGARVEVGFLGQRWTAEVVGVVGDTRQTLQDEAPASVFIPYGQARTGALHFVVRTAGDPNAMIRTVRRTLASINPAMPIAGATTLDGLLDDALRERRVTMSLLLTFSLTALGLAAIGTYGVLSYDAARRSQEIGIRVALGAGSASIVRLVVGQGMAFALIGVGVGAAISLAVTRLLSRFLFGVAPFDPATFIAIAAVLLGVTALASYLPARRAARVGPMMALRAE